MRFNEETRRLLDGKNVATVATLNPDGGPQTSVVWIVRDGDLVLFSTTTARQKARNLARDPRISLTVFDAGDPYQSVDIRGTAELIEDRDKSLLRPLWQKYLGQGPPGEAGDVLRLIVPGDAAEGHRLLRLRPATCITGRACAPQCAPGCHRGPLSCRSGA